MRRKLTLLSYVILMAAAVKAQNIPTGVTAPNGATARLLPSWYPDISWYYQRVLTPVMPTSDSSRVTMNAWADSVLITTQYFDEVGRPYQAVIKQASPSKKDYVVPSYFDEFNRPSVQYLPFVQQTNNTNDGKYKLSQFVNDSAFYKAVFPNEQVIYSQATYEISPLERVLKTTAEGNSWTGANRGISYSQRASAAADSVRLWTIGISGEDDVPSTTSIYAAGGLFVNEVADERGVKAVTYIDELGRTVLTKTQVASSPTSGHAGWLCTYYVYDEMNHLRVVIPPKAVEALNNSTVNWDLASNSTINSGLCYRYYYDDRGRVTMKYIPGKGKSYVAYDLLDRVVMTQDPNLRQTNQWAFVKYDAQSRRTKGGLITSLLSKDSIIAQAARSNDYPNLSGTYTVMSEMYYDDYGWVASSGSGLDGNLSSTNINGTNFNTSYNSYPQYAQQITQSFRIRGAATGVKKLILGTSNYLYIVTIYDDHGRPIQIKETNYSGGTDVLTSQYSFASKVLRTHLSQQKGGSNGQTHSLLSKYSYDHVGRLTSIIKNIDGLGDKTIASNTYNELGQLQNKALPVTTQNYAYNIRGWLAGINKGFVDTVGSTSAYFGENLYYDFGFTNNQYNGSIGGVKWKGGGDGVARAYGLSYDNVNRLNVADFSQQNPGSTSWTKDKVDYTVDALSYDAGGNILTMRQKGLTVASPVTIDSLTYQYYGNSNQLQKVSDGITDSSPIGDFKDTTLTGDDFTYDPNGNVTKDYNRKMYTASNGNGAVYNILDKPDSIAIAGKATVYYYYDATGARLAKKVNDYSTGALICKTYLYLNGFVYMNDTLQYVLHEEGRIRYAQKKNATTGEVYYGFDYDYFLRDHLGNVRTVLTEGRDTAIYVATMEVANQSTEQRLFSNEYDPVFTVSDKPENFDTDTSNHYVSKLNASSSNKKTGPSLVLKVMAGDKVQMNTFAYYNSATQPPGNGVNIISDVLSALSTGVVGASNGKLLGNTSPVSSGLSPGVTQFLNNDRSYDSSRPKAYLNWILFDDQMNYVASNSGVQQVQSGSNKQPLVAPLQTISKNGYLFVYVSNESPQDVYFDDITVKHYTGPLLQEQSYYPFGVEMAAISDKAMNKLTSAYKFNGGDEMEESISMYSTFYRGYDQQLGRFMGVDMASEQASGMSVYQFGANSPVMFNDPLGDKLKDPSERLDLGPLGPYNPFAAAMENLDYQASYGASIIGLNQLGQMGGGFSSNARFELQSAIYDNLFHPQAAYGNPIQRVFDAINGILSKGYTVDAIRYETNSKGVFGASILYDNENGNFLIGRDFVRLPEYQSAVESLHSVTGLEVAGTVLGAGSVSLDLTKQGLMGLQQLANKLGGTKYLITNIGQYKLFKVGSLGEVNVGNLGIGLGILSLTFTSINMWENGANWNNGTDALVGIVSFVPGVGWIIGGSYFFADMVVKSITGKSVGDFLHSSFKNTMFMGSSVGGMPIL
jgi:RHS repeat-associated protein